MTKNALNFSHLKVRSMTLINSDMKLDKAKIQFLLNIYKRICVSGMDGLSFDFHSWLWKACNKESICLPKFPVSNQDTRLNFKKNPEGFAHFSELLFFVLEFKLSKDKLRFIRKGQYMNRGSIFYGLHTGGGGGGVIEITQIEWYFLSIFANPFYAV